MGKHLIDLTVQIIILLLYLIIIYIACTIHACESTQLSLNALIIFMAVGVD